MEIILVVGAPSSGKTTLAKQYTTQGYHRINRDEIGGKLYNLPQIVEKRHQTGITKFVLDNTYADKESRKGIIALAKKLRMTIGCVWLTTSLEDAQFNACTRMIQKTGKLLMPEDFKTTKDPNLFPPAALFGYRKRFEEPTTAEGFDFVNKAPFVRQYNANYKTKSLILDFDSTLRRSNGPHPFPTVPDEVEILPGRKEKLTEYKDNGYLLLGISNQSGIAKGILTKKNAIACFERTNELLGHNIEYHFCEHSVPQNLCWCRKPSVGLYTVLQEKHKLSAKDSIFCGDLTSDATLATRCGLQYYHPNEFFQ